MRACLLAERARWPLWLPVALGAGIAAYFAMPEEPSAWTALLLAAAAVALCAVGGRARPWLLLPAAAVIGFACATLRSAWVEAPRIERQIGPRRIVARVIESAPRDKGLRLLLAPEPVRYLGADTPARIRVTSRVRDAIPAPGSFVRVTAVLMPPPGPAVPGGYDFARWAYFHRLGAVGYLYGRPRPVDPPRATTWTEDIAAGIETMRMRMTARIRTHLPGPEGAIAAALITGVRFGIADEDETAYRDSGLYHVLSISGLHLALAGGIFFWTIRALLALFPYVALRWPVKKIAALAALFGAGFYLTISGCDMPAVRSFIMLAAMFLAVLVDRPALSMRNVALAASLVLLFAPESLLDAGCQMSFASVIGLIALAEGIAARQRAKPRGPVLRFARYAVGIAAASVIAGLASAPLAIYHFERAAPYGLVSNLAAEPAVGLIVMPAATLAMVTMPFGLEAWPLQAMGFGVRAVSEVARWTAALPGAGTLVPSWPLSALVATMLGFLWVALWRRVWRWLGLLAIAAGIALALHARPPDLLVARDFRALAVRLENGRLAFFEKPKDKYAASVWLRRDGDARDWPKAVGDGVRCDGYGCIAHARGGALVAYDKRPEALFEDCARADVVISAVPARDMCKGRAFAIDRFDILRTEGYALWFAPFRVETVAKARGNRPWSPPWRPRRPKEYEENP